MRPVVEASGRAWSVAECPECDRLQVKNQIQAVKTSGCVGCGTKVPREEWIVLEWFKGPEAAREWLRARSMPGGFAPAGGEAPVAGPRAPNANERLRKLLKELASQDRLFTLAELEDAFTREGIRGALQSCKSEKVISCVKPATRAAPSLYRVAPEAWRAVLTSREPR